VPSNDAPGLSWQEYHHVHLGAMFSLVHQAEITRQANNMWTWAKNHVHYHIL